MGLVVEVGVGVGEGVGRAAPARHADEAVGARREESLHDVICHVLHLVHVPATWLGLGPGLGLGLGLGLG